MVVRLLPCVWLLVAAWPLDELREAALLPLLRWLPCWLAPVRELPCCWLLLIPDWLLESCACASWTPPAAGSAETGPATAIAAAAPKMTASIRFFSPEEVPPRRTIRPRTFGFRGRQKFSMNGCLSSRGAPVRRVRSRNVLQEKQHALD
jgi:hypothetical protein